MTKSLSIGEIWNETSLDSESRDNAEHRRYYESFSKLDALLHELGAIEDGFSREQEVKAAIEAQTRILGLTAGKKAKLIQDTLFKLAIWRMWQGSELDEQSEDVSLSDSLVYSVFLDLAEFFNEQSIAKGSEVAFPSYPKPAKSL